MAKKAGNRGKTDKSGSHREAFDHAAALEALAWARGGEQLALPMPGGVARFVGVAPLPDDAGERGAGQPGRPPGARNLVPQAFREYLVARYGSAVEGLAQDATRPIASIVAELGHAYITACRALGLELEPSASQIAEWVTFAKSLQLQARRYVAPYQSSQAPQPTAQAPPAQRIGVLMVAGGAQPGDVRRGARTLAEMLGNQGVTDVEPEELDGEQLDAEGQAVDP